MQQEARRLLITGVVQGVGFRDAMIAAAQAQHVAGWVRNRQEGCVEALIIGHAEQLANMIKWARRGPPAAQVAHICVEWAEIPPESDHSEFIKRPSHA